MSAEIVQVTRREKIELRFRAQSHLLVAYEQGARTSGETMIEGVSTSTLRNFKHKLTFVPAGHQYREWHDPRVSMRIIFIYIDPAMIPVGTETGAAPAFAPRVLVENPAVRETAVKLAALIEDGYSDDSGYLEALGTLLVHELVHLVRAPGVQREPAPAGLAAWQQRIVTAYIEEHMEKAIPLAQLARLARLSRFYFCRAFKASFGVPPHRYVVSRRIDRAKTLLAEAKLSVTDIGWSVGFSEPSSFTAAFRKMTGQTPTSYRKGYPVTPIAKRRGRAVKRSGDAYRAA